MSATFNITYQWNMILDDYGSGSTPQQRDAVAQLMYHMGVAAEMQFGCTSSGSSAWADEALDLYFNYKSSMTLHDRAGDGYSGSQWFALIQAELDADPPRPVVFSVFATSGGGHEVIIDGYQTVPDSATDMVHINYGWSGYYDGFYNITTYFSTPPYTWDANDQWIVTGIEPDNYPPTVDAGVAQAVDEQTLVQLDGSATDPEGLDIGSYLWTQTIGPEAILSSASLEDPTFTAPNVHGTTLLVFQLRANDANRAYATDTCTITVSNNDSSTEPAVEAGDPQTVAEETIVQLIGSATNPNGDGVSSYLWTQLSGSTVTLSDQSITNPTFTAPNVNGTTLLVFQFRANYNDGYFATDTCTVTVSNTDGSTAPNNPPTVNAGSAFTVMEEAVVQLSGSATDPDGDSISGYLWTQLSGPAMPLSNAASATPTFTTPNVNSTTMLVFEFRAEDTNGAYATDTCTVRVINTDGSAAPLSPPPASDTDGGGGCFISHLR